jgi:multiple sugar transport system substrate-binding protein
MKNVQRRISRGLAAAAAATLALTGCAVGGGSSKDQPELTNEPVTLTMTWWGADARTKATNEAIELFEKKYPNINVEPQFSDWGGYWDRLATATAGGDMPDVMQFDQLYLASYADRGTLLDLDTVSNTLDLSVTPESVLQTGQIDGKQYAMPLGGSPNAVIVNKTVLDQYGIPLPDFDTWTWDEFTALAQEVSDKSGGKTWGVGPFGADTFGLTMWARQHGENLYDADGNIAIKPETIVSFWQQAQDWIKSGAAPSVEHIAEGTGAPLDQTDLTLGKLAMAFIPAGQLSAYSKASAGQDFVIGNWPTDADTKDGFQFIKPTMYWAASSKSEHPAEAAALINFLISDPEVAKTFGTDRGLPAAPAAQDAIASTLDPIGKQILDYTKAMTEQAGDAQPITPNGASDSESILSRNFQSVLFGEQSPEAAAQKFIDEMQSSIDAAK